MTAWGSPRGTFPGFPGPVCARWSSVAQLVSVTVPRVAPRYKWKTQDLWWKMSNEKLNPGYETIPATTSRDPRLPSWFGREGYVTQTLGKMRIKTRHGWSKSAYCEHCSQELGLATRFVEKVSCPQQEPVELDLRYNLEPCLLRGACK